MIGIWGFWMVIPPKTNHIKNRQHQRNISDDMMLITIQFREINNSAHILSRNTAAKLLIKYKQKIICLNGLVVIKRDGVMITAFAHTKSP